MKTMYAEVAEQIAGPARERLTAKQREKLKIVKSHQGGETYQLKKGDLNRLTRFLIMGTETGSFYQTTQKLTLENTQIAQKQLDKGPEAVTEIVRVSHEGLAEKQDAILFTLALATRSKNDETRSAAYQAVIPVCRTLSQLCSFLDYRFALGGYDNGKHVGEKIKNARDKKGKPITERYGSHASSMGLRTAIQNWLNAQSDADLAYQIMKYPNRAGLSFRDILRIAKPTPKSLTRSSLYQYGTKGDYDLAQMDETISSRLVAAGIVGHADVQVEAAANMIREFDLPREVVRNDLLNDVNIWTALLQNMPVTAMIRNLGKMTSVGVFTSDENRTLVIDRLNDEQRIKGSRIHPLKVYAAINTYNEGRGLKGDLRWNPDRKIQSALDDAFDLSFKNVVPSNKEILVALDTSSSMGNMAGVSSMSSAAGLSALMALIILRTEPNAEPVAITHEIKKLKIHGNMRPLDAMKAVGDVLGGGTDLGLPFTVAKHNPHFDAIVFFTDSENGARDQIRVRQAEFCNGGEQRRLVLAQMVPNAYGWVNATLQDWDTVGRKSLEIVGFDPSIGKLTSDFLSERF